MERFIAEGYKQTEVGVVPEDWKVVRLADIDRCEIVDGDRGKNYPSSSELRSSGYCLFLNAGNVTTNGFQFNGCEFISKERDALLSKGKLHPNDIVLTTRGTIGNIAFFNNAVPYSNLRINSGMVLIRNNNTSIHINYLFMILKSSIVKRQILQASFGSAQPQLTVRGIGSFKIILPKEKIEQQAIATALSDVDNLITSLEQLIEKKKAIKQGTMQELLTGRRRLKGFGEGKGYKQTELGIIPEHWEYKKLKRLVVDFVVPMRDKPKKFSGEIPWCRIEDFNGKYLEESKTQKCVSSDTIQEMNLRINQRDTLLVSCSADLGRCAIVKKPLVTNQTFIGLVFNDLIADVEFFYYLMGNYSSELNMLSSGTTISYLSREQFEEFEVFYPINKLEQSAIANVLSDLDSEIEDLGTKADKYRQIKQGMMQNLLTGRIRLV